ncbi:MAG: hypothetical protein HDR27_09810 [Lachnospiraceae bacterium]|nr:hypothetical protein [Lachnospiraceae bacterium]
MKNDDLRTALDGKNIPLLTLDNKWHKLISPEDKTPQMKALEEKLNGLVKRQGKVTTDGKDIVKIKKKLMSEVLVIADALKNDPYNQKLLKDMEEHERLLKECNEKIAVYEGEKKGLPAEIEKVNRKLTMATMEICYRKLRGNAREIEVLDDWLNQMRREIKKKAVRKQEMEEINHKIYAYMHDIFGADVIELFDRKYHPEETGAKEKKVKKR